MEKEAVVERDEMVESTVEKIPYRFKIDYSGETEICEIDAGISFEKGEKVIIETRYGRDLVSALGPVCCGQKNCSKKDLKRYIRKANEEDLEKKEQNNQKEEEAFKICRDRIREQKLDMKLVGAHYLVDEAKVLFFFTAEARVDFRELVKNLVSIFKMRIELRQIGVRDESRVLGGLGVCGRDYCCHGVMDDLRPVSIKMAKDQNLSLNSMKISGPCGRLLCCLSYEYDYYQEERKKLPSEGNKVYFGKVYYVVKEINIFSRTVKVSGEGSRFFDIPASSFEYNSEKRSWKLTVSPEN
ncbi:PSP1 domain-containing protein [Spirochaeta isovalerica]|uniref:Cell fate regulator YaaT (PSP1 superfamily) n=1 Tax=Spirochaeta isovalerica TaxID=150 RepID=A0A841R6L3_9SPIO|nr:stage 0 sporulation family protein [Spirochaeta isovalerica]MBB6480844.1 cell fate regulator YaaT (PSP1 superfamily) [Spirochaeta isovalerica]